jgi:hypothetical protein
MAKRKLKTITQGEYDMLRANFQLLTEFFSERPWLLEELKEAHPKRCKKAEVVRRAKSSTVRPATATSLPSMPHTRHCPLCRYARTAPMP